MATVARADCGRPAFGSRRLPLFPHGTVQHRVRNELVARLTAPYGGVRIMRVSVRVAHEAGGPASALPMVMHQLNVRLSTGYVVVESGHVKHQNHSYHHTFRLSTFFGVRVHGTTRKNRMSAFHPPRRLRLGPLHINRQRPEKDLVSVRGFPWLTTRPDSL